MASEYEKAHLEYRKLAKAAANGDATAKKLKADAMAEIRNIERASARAGTILSAVVNKDESITVHQQPTRSKRSLQEEYVHKFADDKLKEPLEFRGKKYDSLRDYHKARLSAA